MIVLPRLAQRWLQSMAMVAGLSLVSPGMAAETLREAVSAALERFPEIQAAQHRMEAARAQVGQARAELFPSINASVGAGRESSRNVSTRTVGDDATLKRREGEISATQLVFDGGAAGGQIRRFAARAAGAEFSLLDRTEDVALRAGEVFVEVRRLREQSEVARENIAVHEKTLADVREIAEAGRGRRVDVTQAQARSALAVSSAEQLSGQLAQAAAVFRHFVGRAPGELAAPPSLGQKLPARIDDALSDALVMHPALKAAEKEVEASQFDRESARARLARPRVTIEAGASRNRDIDGIGGPNSDRYAMLRLRYNLFRGFGDFERVRETTARIDETLAELARVRGELERDVRQAWGALVADRNRLPQLESYARASAEVAEAYRLQFRLGQRSLLDVLNAENERYSAYSSYVAGRAAVSVAELRLLASQGRLIEALGLSPTGAPATDAGPASNAPVSGCDDRATNQAHCSTPRTNQQLPQRYALETPLGTPPP